MRAELPGSSGAEEQTIDAIDTLGAAGAEDQILTPIERDLGR
jgi:hypothetical protein